MSCLLYMTSNSPKYTNRTTSYSYTNYSLLLICPSTRATFSNHRTMMLFTSSGFSQSAQCEVSTCSTVNLGMTLLIPFPKCGGSGGSLSAWMKSTGTVIRRSRISSSSL